MGKIENQLKRLNKNATNVSFEEIETLLKHFGFTVTNKSGGSHYIVKHKIKGIIDPLEPNSIPKRKPIKERYIKNALKWIERVIEYEQNN